MLCRRGARDPFATAYDDCNLLRLKPRFGGEGSAGEGNWTGAMDRAGATPGQFWGHNSKSGGKATDNADVRRQETRREVAANTAAAAPAPGLTAEQKPALTAAEPQAEAG